MPHSIEWLLFDYANQPEEGIYWAVTNTPDYDADVDSQGHTVGWATGEVLQAVCMVRIGVDHDGEVRFDEVDAWDFGKVDAEARVSHYARIVPPALPTLPEAALGTHAHDGAASLPAPRSAHMGLAS